VGAGVVINLYAAIITAIYIYVLYAFIDPGLIEKSLAFAQEKMIARGMPEAGIDAASAMQAKMMKPLIQAISSILYGVFFGLLVSLIVSLFVMKKGNPLLDEVEDEPKQ
jgi:mannitol-specific phosphotransferase system IIBC component